MKFYYPAIVTKESDTKYSAEFPDLEDCHAVGDSLQDVLENAREAAYNWISVEMEDDDYELPPSSDTFDLKSELKPNQSVHEILITYRFVEGWEE
ncbi:MAG: type II toxin-antitoxin system HicB family antitoxin [Eubacteriales bacterium]|jgi:predicted RNase H-like HicB family nuclease